MTMPMASARGDISVRLQRRPHRGIYDRVIQRLHQRDLEGVAGKQLFLIRIRQVAHLDQDGRHIRRFEDAQRRVIHRPCRQRHALVKLLLDDAGESR